MQGTVLAGVELVSAIFHYQYPGKKKKKRNIKPMAIKLKKTQPIVCLESQLKKNVVSILIFVLLWHFFFILKINKESTHNSPAVWVCH